ncbi:transposase [Chloroflexi bacterium TSY]|nr:transposase [Chloroflexi bacterium TSY]
MSWYEQRSPHTQAYDEYLVMQLINSTIEDVSLKEEVGYDAVVGALNRLIEPKINWDEIDEIGTLGIDEISRSKGRKKFSAIITARQPKGKVRILGVLPDRKKKTVKAFLEEIPERLRPTINYCTTDMWEGYINAIDEFINENDDVNASPVVDRFHVAQNYRDDFDDLRKKELRRLKKNCLLKLMTKIAKECSGSYAKITRLSILKSGRSLDVCLLIHQPFIRPIPFEKN